jgi:pimeloyl-ACP methyl ester carboxylesterase
VKAAQDGVHAATVRTGRSGGQEVRRSGLQRARDQESKDGAPVEPRLGLHRRFNEAVPQRPNGANDSQRLRVRKRARLIAVGSLAGAIALTAYAVGSRAPTIAAGGLLHPARRALTAPAPDGCRAETFAGDGVRLQGWHCATTRRRRGTIVYLHGIADNRGSAVGAIRRLLPRGFDVIAYDSRGHGSSEGRSCTYGYYEKRDLSRVLDVTAGPVLLIGSSLGGAVALQAAAADRRIAGVVAAETFSDLETVARERAPSFLGESAIRQAFLIAEEQARFEVGAVSPATAALNIHAPVLLLHGAADIDTPPSHSQRVYANLQGSRRLILIPGAHHNQSLNEQSWDEILRWIELIATSHVATDR